MHGFTVWEATCNSTKIGIKKDQELKILSSRQRATIPHTLTILRLRLSSSRPTGTSIGTSGDELSPSGTRSLQSTSIVSKSSFSVSCHVLVGLPTLLLPLSGIHSKARLAGLVPGVAECDQQIVFFWSVQYE